MGSVRKTKIVCTIGPACRKKSLLRKMIQGGMNVARLNFSHGTRQEHARVIRNLRALSEELGVHLAILQDISGPKIRIGEVEPVEVAAGDTLELVVRAVRGTGRRVSVNYKGFCSTVQPGHRVLINDGMIRLEVVRVGQAAVECKVVVGGALSSHKGVNLPDGTAGIEALTAKDERDLLFGAEHGVDVVAISFVRVADDIRRAKQILEGAGASSTPVLAKIEKREALQNLREILSVANGAMVARGDLGVETQLEEVPLAQKRIIRDCNLLGKPVITATQMLESMVHHPQPTRAEASDVANAILDGTDAVMLSQETAIGEHPLGAVKMMDKTAVKTEGSIDYEQLFRQEQIREQTVEDAISHATCQTAVDLRASAIITCTTSGLTARLVARYRPRAPVIAVSPNEDTLRRLALVRGVYPVRIEPTLDTDDMLAKSMRAALRTGMVRPGDHLVITAGIPIAQPGTTNLLRALRAPTDLT